MVADLDIDSANEVASACKSSAINPNFRVRSIVVDVTLEESVKHAAEDTAEAFGRIDYCVNCAGVCANLVSRLTGFVADHHLRF